MKATRFHVMARAALCTWFAAITIGFAVLADYEATPGTKGDVRDPFPEGWGIPLAEDHFTLIMFAHPRCPCTRASLEELARITARSGDRLSSHLVFSQPNGAATVWSQQPILWRQAQRIPDLQVCIDSGGVLSERFGVHTSGHVLLYDSFGELRYQGGITSSRGHEGDNYGKTAILSLLKNGTADRRQAPVFGCSLLNRINDSSDSRLP